MPDYFEGEFTAGVVSKAGFSIKDNHPVLAVAYKVGDEKFTYTSYNWSLTSYKKGQVVTLIYNPSNPQIASVYSITGYWVQWDELLFSGAVFIILFIAAVIITGKSNSSTNQNDDQNRKRKYDD